MCPSLLVRVRGSTESHRRSAIYFTSSDIARAALIWQHKPTAAAAAAAAALLGDKAVVDVVVFLSVRGFSWKLRGHFAWTISRQRQCWWHSLATKGQLIYMKPCPNQQWVWTTIVTDRTSRTSREHKEIGRVWSVSYFYISCPFIRPFVFAVSFKPPDLDCYICMDRDHSSPGNESQCRSSRVSKDDNAVGLTSIPNRRQLVVDVTVSERHVIHGPVRQDKT